jgi:hypothetical protein
MPLFSPKTVVWRYHYATVSLQNTRVEVPLCHCFPPKQSCGGTTMPLFYSKTVVFSGAISVNASKINTVIN